MLWSIYRLQAYDPINNTVRHWFITIQTSYSSTYRYVASRHTFIKSLLFHLAFASLNSSE